MIKYVFGRANQNIRGDTVQESMIETKTILDIDTVELRWKEECDLWNLDSVNIRGLWVCVSISHCLTFCIFKLLTAGPVVELVVCSTLWSVVWSVPVPSVTPLTSVADGRRLQLQLCLEVWLTVPGVVVYHQPPRLTILEVRLLKLRSLGSTVARNYDKIN